MEKPRGPRFFGPLNASFFPIDKEPSPPPKSDKALVLYHDPGASLCRPEDKPHLFPLMHSIAILIGLFGVYIWASILWTRWTPSQRRCKEEEDSNPSEVKEVAGKGEPAPQLTEISNPFYDPGDDVGIPLLAYLITHHLTALCVFVLCTGVIIPYIIGLFDKTVHDKTPQKRQKRTRSRKAKKAAKKDNSIGGLSEALPTEPAPAPALPAPVEPHHEVLNGHGAEDGQTPVFDKSSTPVKDARSEEAIPDLVDLEHSDEEPEDEEDNNTDDEDPLFQAFLQEREGLDQRRDAVIQEAQDNKAEYERLAESRKDPRRDAATLTAWSNRLYEQRKDVLAKIEAYKVQSQDWLGRSEEYVKTLRKQKTEDANQMQVVKAGRPEDLDEAARKFAQVSWTVVQANVACFLALHPNGL